MLSSLAALLAPIAFTTDVNDLPLPPEPNEPHAIYFRADWCGPCQVLDPKLEAALPGLEAAGVNLIVIDLTDSEADFEAALMQAVNAGLSTIYNGYLGITGFVAVVAPDAQEPVACINQTFTTDGIIQSATTAAQTIRETPALARRGSGDLLCPPMRTL